MSVRDLGYRAYEGRRFPASHSLSVLYRYAIYRAWRSWLVKLGVLAAVFPLLGFVGVAVFLAQTKMQMQGGAEIAIEAREFVRNLQRWELWMSVSLITLGGSASVVAEDRLQKAFPFFFSKPVTAAQYVAAHILGIGTLVLGVVLIPSLVMWFATVGLAAPEDRVTQAMALLPTVLSALVIPLVVAPLALAASALGKSRGVTMGAWILAFVAPHALAALVDTLAHEPRAYLLSLPALIGALSDAIFRADGSLVWWHAALVLVVLVPGAFYFVMREVERAEVVE
jgi:ABC-2 type transport system permease protein